jgi:hypothetical protein
MTHQRERITNGSPELAAVFVSKSAWCYKGGLAMFLTPASWPCHTWGIVVDSKVAPADEAPCARSWGRRNSHPDRSPWGRLRDPDHVRHPDLTHGLRLDLFLDP